MSSRTRRVESQRLVEAQGIPDALTFEDLVRFMESYRGTKISFKESAELNGERVCGAWTREGDVDTVHVPSEAKHELKLFIACHEFGHMLAEPVGNEMRVGESPEIQAFLATLVNPDRIVAYACMGAGDFKDEREATAESIGDQLALRILRATRQSQSRGFQFEQVFTG